MEAKEKSEYLFNRCYTAIEEATAGLFEEDVDYVSARMKAAKMCALLAVDEILNGAMVWQFIEGKSRVFWQQVKEELTELDPYKVF